MDPIADALTRIKSGQRSRKEIVHLPFNRVIGSILRILKEGGYISEFEEQGVDVKKFQATLKYSESGEPVIKDLVRISHPSLRVYQGATEIPRVANGLGTVIVSTPKGIMTGKQAKEANHGGEVLCYVI